MQYLRQQDALQAPFKNTSTIAAGYVLIGKVTESIFFGKQLR